MRKNWLLSTVAGLAAFIVAGQVQSTDARGADRSGQLDRRRQHGRRRRQRQEGRLDDHRQRGHRHAAAASASPPTELEPGKYTLKARAVGYDLPGHNHRRCRGRQSRDEPAQADEDAQSLGTTQQRRMADEHAGHRRAEALPAQLQRLPHLRAHREVHVRRAGLPASLRADERLLPGQHADKAAAPCRHRDARRHDEPRRCQRSQGRRVACRRSISARPRRANGR